MDYSDVKYIVLIISFIFLLASIVFLIVSFFKKAPKKPSVVFFIFSGIIFSVMVFNVGTVKVDKNDPHGTSVYISEVLDIDTENVIAKYTEWNEGIVRKTYEVKDSENINASYATVMLDENENHIERINLHNISDDEVIRIISSTDLPFVKSIEDVLVLPDPYTYARRATFVHHENVGILLVVDNFDEGVTEETENMLVIEYNPDKFDELLNYSNKINEKNPIGN